MKIALISPPWLDIYGDYKSAAKIGCASPPLGLAYLAGVIEKMGDEAIIIDMEREGINILNLVELLKKAKPSIIGLTSTTPVFKNVQIIGRNLRKEFKIPIILGGVHSTVKKEKIITENKFIDAQFIGESESTIKEYIIAKKLEKSLSGIKGIYYREGEKIFFNEPRSSEINLDNIPLPARHVLPTYYYHVKGKNIVKYANIFTSRGCPYQCTFCSQHTMYGRKVRFHSVDRVINEIKSILKLGISHIIFMDETLTLVKTRMIEICEKIIEENLKFTWEGWTHAKTIDENVLYKMKEAGLIRLSFGIESGDQEILKKIKKGVTTEDIRQAYKIAHKVGIETRGSAIIGHQYETKKTAWKTIMFARSIKECNQIFLNIACPYPGTELYDLAKNGTGGLRILTEDYSKYKRYGLPVISVNNLSAKDLKRMQAIGLLIFYLTPRRIYYNIFKRTSIKTSMLNVFAFIKSVIKGLTSKEGK